MNIIVFIKVFMASDVPGVPNKVATEFNTMERFRHTFCLLVSLMFSQYNGKNTSCMTNILLI